MMHKKATVNSNFRRFLLFSKLKSINLKYILQAKVYTPYKSFATKYMISVWRMLNSTNTDSAEVEAQ